MHGSVQFHCTSVRALMNSVLVFNQSNLVIDVPAPVLNFGNFEGCHFQHLGARERERELSKEQYAIEAAAEVAYCFELDSLSLSLSLIHI